MTALQRSLEARLVLVGARARIVVACVVLVGIATSTVGYAQTQAAGASSPAAVTASDDPKRGATVSGHALPSQTIPVSNKPVATNLPRRHEGRPLTWDPAFNRMDTPEMVAAGVFVGVALAAAIAPPLKTGWKGGILFDDAARKTLRLASYKARLDFRDASDVGLAFLTSFPILVDSMMVAYWYRGSDDVALQMTLIDAEAMAVAAAVQGSATFFSGRERPYGQDCGGELRQQSIDCQSPSRTRSFFSGHSTLSFTSAALICAHHLSLNLFDSAADPVTCASGFVAAAAVGTLRVVGDVHYLSDVLTGALIGTGIGLGIPLLHHYKKGVSWLGTLPGARVSMRLVPTPGGAQIVGEF